MTGVSVICLLFPPAPEGRKLARKNKGRKEPLFRTAWRRERLPLFVPFSTSSSLPSSPPFPFFFSPFLPPSLFLSFSHSFSIERNLRRRDGGGGGGGVGSVNVWKMSDENLKQTRRQPAPCPCFDVSETGRRRSAWKVTVIDNFLIVSDAFGRFKLAEHCESGFWGMICFKMPWLYNILLNATLILDRLTILR